MALMSPVVGTVFPSFSFLRVGSRPFRVWHPRGPDKTEVWSWVYVDQAAPPHVKEAVRLAGMRGFGPSGSFEQDDMDNWQECTRGLSRGGVAAGPSEHADGTRPRALRSGSQCLGQRFPHECRATIGNSIAAGRS